MAKKKPRWTESGIDAERKRVKRIYEMLAKRAASAKKRRHPVHAKRMAALAKHAKQEYDRLTRLDSLSGPEDYSSLSMADIPIALAGDGWPVRADLFRPPFTWKGVASALVIGFLVGSR